MKHLVIITGASKGFGRACSIAFTEGVQSDAGDTRSQDVDLFVVGGRDVLALQETLSACKAIKVFKPPTLHERIWTYKLSSTARYINTL